MLLRVRFDTKNNKEIINQKIFPLGTNFVNFISLDIENILSNKIISKLTKNNYKEILSKIASASNSVIIEELINTNDISNQNNIQLIKRDLKLILDTYTNFKELTEFCYFNDNFKNMTLLQKYIYYLNMSKVEEVILPKQTISLKLKMTSNKFFKNDDITKNSPFLYFSYQCLNINDYMTASFLQLIESNYLMLKCKNCGKYFIVFNSANKLYCSRKSPQDSSKTCRQYGREKTWLERTKDENDWYSIYRKIYQALQVKVKRNPNNVQFKQNYDNFRADAKEWKKAVKEGTKTEAEFMKWLQDFRK